MLTDEPITNLIGEINRVFGKAIDGGVRDNQPPKELVDKLRSDVFVFSACKGHIELKELSTKLMTETGKVASWGEFRKEALALHETYNERYLKAEYEFAVNSAQMAARWADVSKDGDRYNLQYRTAGDDRVRDSHDKLRGTTLPATDPFWDSYYPPNGWHCRCTAVQVLKGKYPESDSEKAVQAGDKATTQLDRDGRNRAEMFRFNPGKRKIVFPPHHPYRKVQEGILKIIGGVQAGSPQQSKGRRKQLLQWGRDNLLKDSVHHSFDEIQHPITFSVTGIKEYLNQPHKHYDSKNEALRTIKSLILSSKYIRWDPDNKNRPHKYHYLKSEVNGEASYIVIKEDLKKGKAWLYSNVDKLKKK